jgi:hypothetical protein
VVFSLIALRHAIRLLFGRHVTIENMVVPVWISWIGLVVATYLAYGLPIEQVVDEAS